MSCRVVTCAKMQRRQNIHVLFRHCLDIQYIKVTNVNTRVVSVFRWRLSAKTTNRFDVNVCIVLFTQ